MFDNKKNAYVICLSVFDEVCFSFVSTGSRVQKSYVYRRIKRLWTNACFQLHQIL